MTIEGVPARQQKTMRKSYVSFFAPFKAGGGSSKGSPLAFASWRRRYQASQSWCAAALPLSSPLASPITSPSALCCNFCEIGFQSIGQIHKNIPELNKDDNQNHFKNTKCPEMRDEKCIGLTHLGLIIFHVPPQTPY